MDEQKLGPTYNSNSLLNKKKFVFPAFTFEISNISVSSKEGYIAWSDLHKV